MKQLIIILALLNAGALFAQDRLFTYTYQSTVLNKGQKEIEVWNTLRTGRDDFYSRLDHRTEFEVGLGSSLQTAFYLNLTSKTTTVIANDVYGLKSTNEISFSNEWKFKVLDPVVHPLGLALYGEYGIGTQEYEIEGKLILDKKISKLTLAANAVYELELKPEPDAGETEWEQENKADLILAAAWSFSPRFALTWENAYKNVYHDGEIEHSALYSGPGFSYVQENFWVNFTAMPQLTSFKGHEGNSLNLKEFEKIQLRLLFSYVF